MEIEWMVPTKFNVDAVRVQANVRYPDEDLVGVPPEMLSGSSLRMTIDLDTGVVRTADGGGVMGMGSAPAVDGESPWSRLGLCRPVGRPSAAFDVCAGQTPSSVQICRREPTAAEQAAQWGDLAERYRRSLGHFNRKWRTKGLDRAESGIRSDLAASALVARRTARQLRSQDRSQRCAGTGPALLCDILVHDVERAAGYTPEQDGPTEPPTGVPE